MNTEFTKNDLLYEQRITKVEEICRNHVEAMISLKSDMREIKAEIRSEFRWLFGLILVLGAVMAHGFKWF